MSITVSPTNSAKNKPPLLLRYKRFSSYSFPLYGKMKGYVQYFYGYGESLIDYNARANRVSAGVAISDWF